MITGYNRQFFSPFCHTYPNDRLLQPAVRGRLRNEVCCHTYPNDRLLQHPKDGFVLRKKTVVIPILTIGFYNTDFNDNKR